MDDNKNKILARLGDYVSEVFDMNGDGRIDIKDLFAVVPSQAVLVAGIVVDLLILVAETRVWDAAMVMTGNDAVKSIGFVAISALPFYLGQLMWLYPRASGFQQLLAGLFVVGSLYTSATIGFADLTQQFDIERIASMAVWLLVAYVVGLILYVITDEGIRAHRIVTVTKSRADLQTTIHNNTRIVLGTLRGTLEEQARLANEFTPEAVDAQLSVFNKNRNKNKDRRPALGSGQSVGNQPPQKQYQNWNLDPFLVELDLSKDQAKAIIQNNGVKNADELYAWLKPYGIEDVDISRKNFARLFNELQGVNPTVPSVSSNPNGRQKTQ